ncbi:type I-D CRISPR-associated protein Cas10d/Csc3 [Candidatus Poribacteria bacterium]|nr:type I-D CRISPR-associated protein Cas10d/Csc3 [Candidatus Poribacteria bacterium]
MDNIESKTRGKFSKFIQNSSAGIKIDEKCLLLRLSFQEIWNEVRNIITEKTYAANVDAMNDRSRRKLQEDRGKLVGSKRNKKNPDPVGQVALIDKILDEQVYLLPPDDVAIRIGELVRTYYIFLNEHFSSTIPDAWNYIYDLLKLPLEIEDATLRPRYTAFSKRYDRGYIIGRDLYNSEMSFDEVYELILQDGSSLMETIQMESEFGVLKDYVHKYVDFDFAVGRDKDFATNLTRYVKDNHVQCSTCGSEFDTDLWMKPDVPPNIKVQQFSNRLQGGSSREPKRRVCRVCRTQYMLDKICYNVTSSTSTFFIHLYPPSFFTDGLIKAFRAAQNRFRDPDFPSSIYIDTYNAFRIYRERAQLVLPVSKTKSNGNPIPEFSEALGNILTIRVNTPGQNNHTENILFAIKNALLYQRFLGCRAVLTDSSIPLFSADEFSHFFIDHIPSAFRGWLPYNDLDSNMTKQVFDQLINLHNIQVKIESFETGDLVRLIRSLNYDALELYYVTHKMIKREQAGNEPLQFATVRDTAQLIADVVTQKGGNTIMSYIKELARIAWEGHLRGQTQKDTSLAKPLDIAFDCLSRWNENRFKQEDIRALISKEISRAIERLTPSQYLSDPRREKILQQSTEFVDVLLNQLLNETYQGELNELVEDHRKIRSTYIFYLHSERIAKSEKKEEEQKS